MKPPADLEPDHYRGRSRKKRETDTKGWIERGGVREGEVEQDKGR